MVNMQLANLELLPLGTVLLVDTEDACLKLIIDYDIGVINGRCIHVSNLDEDEMEEDRGTFSIPTISVGEPMTGVLYPRQRSDGVIEIGGMLQTTPVKTIEVYQDEETA